MLNLIYFFVLIRFALSLNKEQSEGLLEYHNKIRRNANPPAADMTEMVYDEELERLAEDWVKRCVFEHPNPSVDTQYRGIGQNLAVTGGSKLDVIGMATDWHSEVKGYTYDSNTCAPGKVCGHYTQMAWAKSTHLGCAVKECNGMMPGWGPPIYLMACQYKPQGNYRGAKPYETGGSCSKCPAGTVCKNNLCSTDPPPAEKVTSPPKIVNPPKDVDVPVTTSTPVNPPKNVDVPTTPGTPATSKTTNPPDAGIATKSSTPASKPHVPTVSQEPPMTTSNSPKMSCTGIYSLLLLLCSVFFFLS